MKLLNDMFSITGGEADNVKITLNAEHPIYKAHFPGNPITPGVCIVQIIGELLGERTNRKLTLSSIKNLKFIATISPVENPEVEVLFSKVEEGEEAVVAKGTVVAGTKVMTKFSLTFSAC